MQGYNEKREIIKKTYIEKTNKEICEIKGFYMKEINQDLITSKIGKGAKFTNLAYKLAKFYDFSVSILRAVVLIEYANFIRLSVSDQNKLLVSLFHKTRGNPLHKTIFISNSEEIMFENTLDLRKKYQYKITSVNINGFDLKYAKEIKQ
jgi:hypothetical protein